MSELAETETLSSVNSLTTLSRNIGFLLGPALGAIWGTLFGQASAFAFDGLTFAISALFLLALRLPPSPAPSQVIASAHPAEAGGPREGVWGAMRDAREGLRYVFSPIQPVGDGTGFDAGQSTFFDTDVGIASKAIR